jgi:putative transposase
LNDSIVALSVGFPRRLKSRITLLAYAHRSIAALTNSVPSLRVVRVLEDVVTVRGRPTAVRVDDNGPDFLAQSFVDWAAAHRLVMHYIQPGKPDQNAYIERFNRTYRTEVLNAHLFDSTADLQALMDIWLRIYNRERPHDSLGRKPPLTFLRGHHQRSSLRMNCLLDGEFP